MNTENQPVKSTAIGVRDAQADSRFLKECRRELDFISAVLTATGVLVVAFDPQGHILRFNRVCENVTGYTCDDVRGRKSWDFLLCREDIESAKKIFSSLNNGISSIKADQCWLDKKGRKRMICWSNATLCDADGRVQYIVATGIDITTQHLNTTAQNAWHEQFRILSEYAYDWEYWINPQGRFVHVAPSCERLTGYKPNDFYEDPDLILALVHPEDRSKVEDHFKAHKPGVEHCQMDFRIVTAEGQIKWICHHCRPVFDKKGQYKGQRASNRDISKRKQAEQALLEREQELKKNARHLEEVNRALKLMLDHRHIETQAVARNSSNNLKRHIAPYLEKLSACALGPDARILVNILQTNIEDLINTDSNSLFGKYRQLTPTEVHVADLIRQGMSSKEIAETLAVSPSTINIHRNNIRKKLGLLNTKTNLRSFLHA